MKADLCIILAGLFVVNAAGARADEAKPTILYIGDSHSVGTFGKVEDQLLRGMRSFGVATYASCGSSPDWWTLGKPTTCGYFWKGLDGKEQRGTDATTPLISDLLKQMQPRYTIVEQGANLYGAPMDYSASTSEALAKAITASGSACIWIGPPNGRNKPEPQLGQLWDAMSKVLAPMCTLVDSRPYTYYPATGGDGVHFDSLGPIGVKIATDWADSVFKQYQALLKP